MHLTERTRSRRTGATGSADVTPREIEELPIEFSSQGAVLRGWFVKPAGATQRLPTVIMAHGTSATLQMVAIEYARSFARAGIAALIYDHRGFGASGGEPRLQINPWLQCRGYIDALSFASSRPDVDPQRLGLWGDSYTGGQVVVVSACDARPRVLVAQCPTFGASVPEAAPSEQNMAMIRRILADGDVTGTSGTTTGPLPVVSSDQSGTPSLLLPIQAFRWFIDYGGRPGSGWVNRVTRVIPATPAAYSPYLCAPFVQADVLLMVAPADEMAGANYQVAQRAFALMPGVKRWLDVDGGHFGLLYHPGALFDRAVRAQAAFLLERLAPAASAS